MRYQGGYSISVSQVSVYSGTADRRSLWHALRPALVLGGFVALWWALMTGVAHADSKGEGRNNLTDTLRTSAKAHHKAPVREVARRVHHDVQAATSKAVAPARQHAAPIVRTTTTVVSETPVAPVAEQVTQTVRRTASGTAATTRSLLTKVGAGPVTEDVRDTIRTTVQKPESSTVQGNSASKRHLRATSATLLPSAGEASATQSAPTTEPDRESASTDAGSPVDGPLGSPSAPVPCAPAHGSGSSSVTPVGIVESSWLSMPSVTDDLRSWRLARLPGGPAYEPGSSPD
jgi:hypothetical protein